MKEKKYPPLLRHVGRVVLFAFFLMPLQQVACELPNRSNQEMADILRKLEEKYGISITVDAGAVQASEKVALNIKKHTDAILQTNSIAASLNLILEDTELEYAQVRSDYYIIRKKESGMEKAMPEKTASVQLRSIRGEVRDGETGDPLLGVNIQIKGTYTGTITDQDGIFNLELPEEGAILVITYIGYKTLEKEVTGSDTELMIVLEQDKFGLEEVVVSGVASRTPRKNLSISVAKVNENTIKEVPSSSASTALDGKVAGVTVVQGNGLPGSEASIRLRGSTSLTGNQAPMIIMDGTIINTNLSHINVDDIESYEVVKGAAAAALYGSRAGNGVIVINTKRGNRLQKGTTSVIFRLELGYQELAKKIETSTHHPYQLADDWEEYDYTRYDGVFYKDDGTKLSGARQVTSSGFADQPFYKIYDHQDLFFNKGLYNTTYLGLQGNTEQTNFMLSYEHNKQEGIITETKGYTRNNLKFNLDHRISRWAKISTSNLFIKAHSQNPGNSWSAFKDLLFISPDVDLTEPNQDGSPYKINPDQWDQINENPLYPIHYRERSSERMSFIGNIRLVIDITPWLDFDTKYTYEYMENFYNTLTPKGYLGGDGQTIGGSLYKRHYNQFNQNYQATLNLNKQFGDFTTKLKLSYLYENNTYRNDNTTGKDFTVADVPQFINVDPELTQLGSYEGNIVAINYFSILDLDYRDKYIFSGLYRIDGSSLFGSEERWHPYYRLSGAYRVTQEISIPGINELKVRASYGTSGQRPGFSNQYETWTVYEGILSKNTLGNNYLKPSRTKEFETGLDMEFLKRFFLEFVYSNSLTEDALALAPLATHEGGFPYQWKNVGEIQSNVYELSLSINLIEKNNWKWNARIIFDRIRQQLVGLNIPDYKTGPRNAFFMREGETFGVIYGYRWLSSLEEMSKQLPEGESISDYEINSDGYLIPAGTQGTTEEIPIRLDADMDGNADIVEIGDGNPDFRLSLSNTLNYKGFTLYALLSYKQGGSIYNYTHQYMFRDLRAAEIDQFGKPEAEKKTINYYSSFYNNTEINSYFIENGSFLKIKELSLYYVFNSQQLAKLFGKEYVKSIRLGVQGRNLFTFTGYSGYDPEVASGTDHSNFPFDDFGYPNFRTYSASVQFNF
ncbi:MAG: SusC/RagA family TonB-linked outer membrane protein [Bacteroidota bacterium]|nr:SusC/RagA family TonB-linked outer membrane protein [Bacteroidota bacterium]